MTKNVLKKFGFVRIAVAACVGFPLFIVTSVYAQTPTPSPAAAAAGEATTERVIVTGSNIPTTETESALPVTVYSAEVLQKNGANTAAEGLRQLPSYVGNTATENNSNGGDGEAFISLRGLGAANVLNLINGRRYFTPDLNGIPLGAVSRVEILKDGASSVYGSDAVSGVVNFIFLNGPGEKPYEGAEFFFLYGNTTDRDARVVQTYLKGGVTGLDGKVSIAAEGEYYNKLDIYSRDRDISKSVDNRRLGGSNGGSANFPGVISYRTDAADPNSELFATLVSQSTQNPRGGMPSPDYREFDAAGGGTDPDRFNFRAYTPAIPGVEKAQYYVTGRYKIFDDMLQMYGDMLYSKTKFNTGFAPSPFALDAAEANNSPFNPFLNPTPDTADTPTLTSDDQLQFLAYRLVQELGNRKAYYDTDHYRYTVGFNGEFNMTNNQFISNWGYDTGFLYERFFEIQTESGDAKRSSIVAAIAAGNFDPFIGQGAPVAGTANTYVNGTLTGTQAYDNKAATAAASYEATSLFKERDFLYDVTVHGNLFPELWNGGIGVSAGYVHQHSGLSAVNDSVLLSNDTLGFNGAPSTKYLQEVDSFSGEIRLPLIVSTQNLPWMRSLELSFAYRYEEFEDRNQLPIPGLASKASFNNGGDPRISIRIQPIEDVILRASYGKSFRSPALGDLFAPPLEDFPIIVDPVKGTAEQPPNGVWEQGNPGLQPEETDSYSAGVVYTPKFVRDLTGGTLTMTVDLYQMYTTNVILSAAFEAQVLVTQGVVDPDGPGLGFFPVNGVFGGPALGVTRLASGRLSAIDSKAFNAGKRLVNGMDANAVYQLPTENFGSFTWTLGYNYFFTWKGEAGKGTGTHSFLGDYNSTLPLAPGAIPYHKGFLRGEWEWRGFDFVATGNYISSFNDDSAFLRNPRATLTNPNRNDPQWSRYRKVNDYITLDMQLGYTFKKPVTEAAVASYAKDAKDAKNAMAPVGGADNGTFAQRMLWNTTLTAGVVNAFDRSPPILFAAFNDNYDTSLYNIRDRYYYISLSKKF